MKSHSTELWENVHFAITSLDTHTSYIITAFPLSCNYIVIKWNLSTKISSLLVDEYICVILENKCFNGNPSVGKKHIVYLIEALLIQN